MSEPKKSPRLTIPITPLRRLYRFLRVEEHRVGSGNETKRRRLSQKEVVQRAFLEPYFTDGAPAFDGDGARGLARLFQESVKTFESYDNPEAFVDAPEKRSNDTHDVFARRLVRKMKEAASPEIHIPGTPEGAVRYLDYEVSPIRTTRSEFADGKSGKSSGQGGLDVLLAWASGDRAGIPILGELKARTESVGPLFAFLQCLTYAAELVTTSQWARLLAHYPRKPNDGSLILRDKPRLDIMLLMEESADDRWREEAGLLAESLRSRLLVPGSPIERHVSAVFVVTADADGAIKGMDEDLSVIGPASV